MMNVFYTNDDPTICAFEHCTVHTRKMIIEYAQMLSTAHRVLDGDTDADKYNFYKKTHVNHPSAKWVRQSKANYWWLYRTFVNLCNIYENNAHRKHATSRLLVPLSIIPKNIPDGEFTDPPMAMPDEFKCDDTTLAYRNYVNSKYVDWRTRTRPMKVEWYTMKPDWAV